MLRITQQDSSKDAKRYYASADYYSEGQELVGLWGGKGAHLLGLEGTVDKHSFDRLCDNLNPISGQPLTVRTRSDRTVGYDFTFSVPKSVSLLYALTGDREILDAFRNAVDETMCDIETEAKTRVRQGGKNTDRLTGNLTWAEFIHTTSRPVDGVPDPQLHAHCFVFNSTWDDKECRWKAGQFRHLKADAPYFQAAFRVRLASKLQDLGFGVERKRDDFEVCGVPASAIRRFSRRTEEIEKVAAERGITDPKRKAELGAETREKKNHELSLYQLRKEWDSRLTDSERQAIAEAHRREVPYPRAVALEGQAVDYALDHSFTRNAVVAERELLTEAMKRGLGAVTVEGVQRELAGRCLIRGEKDGRAIASTEAILAEERRVIAFAREGRGRFRPLGDSDRPFTREWLNADQKAAVRHVLGSRDRVTLIRGAAGTGKTTLEQELGEALAETGKGCVAIAPSAAAGRSVLREEAGFANADTVARFLRDERLREQARGGLILLDEASLIGTRDTLALFEAADRLNARLVILGDRRQHRSVARGQPLKLLEEQAGLPVAEVRKILRQGGEYLKVTEALSAGNTEEGFAALDRLGWIKEIPDGERERVLADAYLDAIQEKKRSGEAKTALVVSPTHAEAARITATIRSALKADRKLGEERTLATWVPAHLTVAEKTDAASYDAGDMLQFHQNSPGIKNGSRLVVAEGQQLPVQCADRFEVYRPAKLIVAVGDRVRVTANGKTKDGKHRLDNGTLFTVKGFTPQGDPVVDHGWVIGKEFGHLAAGYVLTSHASQGRTVDKVFIGMSSKSLPATNRRTGYVAVTRGKEQVQIFTDDRKELLKMVSRPDEPLSAAELADSIRRKAPRRQRLHKRLAFIHRIATFARTHEPLQPEIHRAKSLGQEMSHAR